MKKHRYVTQRAHGGHPAGSPCLAYRNEVGTLFLEFEGETMQVGDDYYLIGIEPPLNGSVLDRAIWDIQAQEDARVFELFNQYSSVLPGDGFP